MILSIVAISILGCFHEVVSAPYGQTVKIEQTTTYKFKIEHSLIMTYTSSSQRDALLQRIYDLWKPVLAKWGATNISNKFIEELAIPGSDNMHAVKYRISGTSTSEVQMQDATADFEQTLATSGIQGVSTIATFSGQLPAGTGGSSGFSWTVDFEVIYNGAGSVPDDLLQQILQVWQTSMASFGFTDEKISVVSQRTDNNRQIVMLRLTGKSKNDMDVGQYLISNFIPSLRSANIPQISVGQYTKPANKATGTQNVNVYSGSTVTKKNTVTFTSQIFLTYNTDAERDAMLQKLVPVWQNVLSMYGVSNVRITFSRVVSSDSSSGSRNVEYQIVAEGVSDADNDRINHSQSTINDQFQQYVTDANIPGVSVNALSTKTSGNAVPVPNVPSGYVAPVPNVPSGNVVQVPNFNTNTNRKTNQQQSMFSNMNMNMGQNQNMGGFSGMQQNQNMGGFNAFPFSFTDQSGTSVFKYGAGNNKQNTPAPYITPDTPAPYVAPVVTQAPKILNYGGNTNTNTNGGTYTNTNTNTGSATNYGGNTDSSSNTNAADTSAGGAAFQYDTSVYAQDQPNFSWQPILDQLLNVFKNSFSAYQLSGVTIYLIREDQPDANGLRKGYYRITGESGNGILDTSQPSFQKTYNQAITNAGISGVSTTSTTRNTGGVSAAGTASAGGSTGNEDDSGSDNQNNQNWQTTGGASFQLDDTVTMTYKSTKDRDNMLQQLLDLFKTTFASQQLSSMTVFMIQDFRGPQYHTVQFRITGQAGTGYPNIPQMKSQFDDAIQYARFPHINLPNMQTGIGTIAPLPADYTTTTTTTVAPAPVVPGYGTIMNPKIVPGPQPFEYTGTLLLTYNSQQDLNNLISQILSIFKTTFSAAQLSNLKITVISGGDQQSSATNRQLSFKITGLTGSTDFNQDTSQTTSQFLDAVENANVNGIIAPTANGRVSKTQFQYSDSFTISSSQDVNNFLQQLLVIFQNTFSSYQMTNLRIVPTGTQGNPVQFTIYGTSIPQFQSTSDDAAKFRAAYQQSSLAQAQLTPFQYNSAIWLQYSSTAQRDSLLQRVLTVWNKYLSQYQIANFQIKFITEEDRFPGSGVKYVTYQISGSSQATIDFASIAQQVLSDLTSNAISGIFADYSGPEKIVQPPTTNYGQTVSGSVGPGDFSIPGTVKLTYTNSMQRDTFLQQVLVMWRNTLFPYQTANVNIKMTGESGSGPTKTVSYVITGTSATAIDLNEATANFQDTLVNSHLIGITYGRR